jgi:uncharacterized metal-binding protein
MSNAKVHDIVTLISCPLVIIISSLISIKVGIIIGISFLFSGFMFNGDLDIHSEVYKRWWIFKYLWYPYRLFGHRSKWTHGFIIGTLIRIIWIGIPFGILVYEIKGLEYIIRIISKQEFLIILIGLELGSMSHSIVDMFSTGSKSIFR